LGFIGERQGARQFAIGHWPSAVGEGRSALRGEQQKFGATFGPEGVCTGNWRFVREYTIDLKSLERKNNERKNTVLFK
jgi:hypothetical protein